MPKEAILEANGRSIIFWSPEGTPLPTGTCGCPNMDARAELKLVRVCRPFIETGKFPRNDTKFKAVTGHSPLCAIKPDKQLRLLGYFQDLRTFVVVMCVRKKNNKHKTSDLKRAQELVGEHQKTY
nr:hypothetical protein [uncultured Pseudodesulfovibrio sp.]